MTEPGVAVGQPSRRRYATYVVISLLGAGLVWAAPSTLLGGLQIVAGLVLFLAGAIPAMSAAARSAEATELQQDVRALCDSVVTSIRDSFGK